MRVSPLRIQDPFSRSKPNLFFSVMLVPVPDYLRQPPAYFHTRILVGPGAFLTPKFVHERNISHVINCAYPEDSPAWFQSKVPRRYMCLNAPDTPSANILDWYPAFEHALHSFLRETSGGVVYVHCQAGMNRSASLALAYVCTKFHLDGPTMLEAFQRQRPCMFQNAVYRSQVLSYINGYLSRAENPRGALGGSDNRDIGFCSSGCRTVSSGADGHADRASE